MRHPWANIFDALPSLLTPDQDEGGALSWPIDPPASVVAPTIAVAKRVQAISQAERRKERAEANKVLERDFKVSGQLCWKSVREPSPSPVNVILNPDESTLFTASPRVPHSALWKVWAPFCQR